MNSILFVHNYYRQPGGEDNVFAAERAMLRDKGHTVHEYIARSDSISAAQYLAMPVTTLWNRRSAQELARICREKKPEVVHFHNTFPLISPSAYYAAKRAGAAVVQTLHNYRLICPDARFFRKGRVCEDCMNKNFAWPSLIHRCYQKSFFASLIAAAMLALHKKMGTYARMVDTYIALTNFAKAKLVEAGFDSAQISVKPNFLQKDPGAGNGDGGYFLVAARLSAEKGVDTLLAAWRKALNRPALKIAGDGPLSTMVADRAQRLGGVDYLGHKSHDEVLALMKNARALVIPSLWYEGFPMTVVEAYASGLPVIASNLGSLGELVINEKTGLLFECGNAEALAKQANRLCDEPALAEAMRTGARNEYEQKYNAEQNYKLLINIYQKAIEKAKQ